MEFHEDDDLSDRLIAPMCHVILHSHHERVLKWLTDESFVSGLATWRYAGDWRLDVLFLLILVLDSSFFLF